MEHGWILAEVGDGTEYAYFPLCSFLSLVFLSCTLLRYKAVKVLVVCGLVVLFCGLASVRGAQNIWRLTKPNYPDFCHFTKDQSQTVYPKR